MATGSIDRALPASALSNFTGTSLLLRRRGRELQPILDSAREQHMTRQCLPVPPLDIGKVVLEVSMINSKRSVITLSVWLMAYLRFQQRYPTSMKNE